MTWIRTTPPADAGEQLDQIYNRVRDPRTGELDNIMAVHSLNSEGLAAHFELYRTVMRGTRSLRKVDRELIALVVSQLNSCHY